MHYEGTHNVSYRPFCKM